MAQLAPLDAMFLSLETEELTNHIGSLMILDPTEVPGFGFDRFRRFLGDRVASLEDFRQRVVEVPFGLDRPYWARDESFRLDDHLHRVALPAPGGRHELEDLVGRLFAGRLEREHPLWEVHWIEGLEGGRIALLWKLHHCLMDGESGARLIGSLFGARALRPKGASPSGGDSCAGPRLPNFAGIVGRAAWHSAGRQASSLQQLSRLAFFGLDSLRRDGSVELPARAPDTLLNGRVGRRRAFAGTSVSIDRLKRLGRRLDASVNELLLAVTGGALRAYLLEHEALPDEPLIAVIPVSTRGTDRVERNRFGQAAVGWATHVADPIERLRRIQRESRRAVRSGRRTETGLLGALGESLAPFSAQVLARLAQTASPHLPLFGTAVFSNVRGPDRKLAIAGARLECLTPLSVLPPTQGLNLTVMSYGGKAHFGITTDPEIVRNAARIADAIPLALDDLETATVPPSGEPGRAHTSPRRPRAPFPGSAASEMAL